LFLGVIPRKDYLQAGYYLRKGADARLRARGVEALRREIVTVLPELSSAVNELTSMDDVKLLDIRINRLRRWYTDGLLCIGDAAHAMSPAGGVGINLAVQDAVGAATLLAAPLRDKRLTTKDLAAVQRRRSAAAAAIQTLQRGIHKVMDRALGGRSFRGSSRLLPVLARFPQLSVIPAYVMGVGVRPEHAPEFARRSPQPVSATMDQ
jgi:2-polyprenyl-6-methoxyphenol hydroxylase-like FAD-dependent oxidoreductase